MCKSRFNITQLSRELKVWICPSESVDSACEIIFCIYSPVDSLNCCWAAEMRAIPSKQIVPGAGKCSIWCLYNVTFREYCPYPFSMEFARKIWTCRGNNILQPQYTNQCQTTLLRLEARARLSVPRFAHVGPLIVFLVVWLRGMPKRSLNMSELQMTCVRDILSSLPNHRTIWVQIPLEILVKWWEKREMICNCTRAVGLQFSQSISVCSLSWHLCLLRCQRRLPKWQALSEASQATCAKVHGLAEADQWWSCEGILSIPGNLTVSAKNTEEKSTPAALHQPPTTQFHM